MSLLSATDLADFFEQKITKIRSATEDSSSADNVDATMQFALQAFQQIQPSDVLKSVNDSLCDVWRFRLFRSMSACLARCVLRPNGDRDKTKTLN